MPSNSTVSAFFCVGCFFFFLSLCVCFFYHPSSFQPTTHTPPRHALSQTHTRYRREQLRYANNSNYKNDQLIRKEMYVSPEVIAEVKRIIADSEITKEDDREWPEGDRCASINIKSAHNPNIK